MLLAAIFGVLRVMDFGAFTLSDNHHRHNPRTANQFIARLVDETIYADPLGL